MPSTIAPFADAHLDDAAALLSGRERARATREPETPHRVDTADMAREAIAEVRRAERVDGVVALRGGSLSGFMLGARELTPPTSDASLFLPPRAALISERTR